MAIMNIKSTHIKSFDVQVRVSEYNEKVAIRIVRQEIDTTN